MFNHNINLSQDKMQRMQQLLQYYKYDMIMRELKKYSTNSTLNNPQLNFPNFSHLQPNPHMNIPNNYLIAPQMDLNSIQESILSPNNCLPNFTNPVMVEVYLD